MVEECDASGDKVQYCITSNLKSGFRPLTFLCSKHYKEYIENKLDSFRLTYNKYELD
jgi:hypothetical protein